MIVGIGCDLVEVSRLRKWISKPDMLKRFFNEKEMCGNLSDAKMCEHYAVRFAAKEAFGKALGTGICGWQLKDVFVQKDSLGKPFLIVEGDAKNILEKKTEASFPSEELALHLSLSHEKDYALAYAIIERR